MRNVVCWLEICVDGSTQWEMVDPLNGECIEYFHNKLDAELYAVQHDINITEWIED
jgi:hypothetical protein